MIDSFAAWKLHVAVIGFWAFDPLVASVRASVRVETAQDAVEYGPDEAPRRS